MFKKFKYVIFGLVIAQVAFVFQNCGQPGSIIGEKSDSNPIVDPTGQDGIVRLPSSKYICEPFGGGGGSDRSGLRAELSALDPNVSMDTTAKNALKVEQYFAEGDNRFIRPGTDIFLSQVNVPSRLFDQGFQVSDGQYLTDSNGQKLIEYFGLKMTSILKLRADQPEGYYELATLSDDGSKLYLKTDANGPYNLLINNDDSHATRMICADQAVYIGRNSRIPMKYYYNQGPRHAISNVMVMKYHGTSAPDLSARTSAVCGQTSADGFWKRSTQEPQELWSKVQEEKYKILGTGNFLLPDNQVNPCATQNTDLIAEARFSELVDMKSELNVTFKVAANIKAQLFKINGADRTHLQTFDFSAQMKDRITVALPTLVKDQIYSLEILLTLPENGTKVLNEVRFQVKGN